MAQIKIAGVGLIEVDNDVAKKANELWLDPDIQPTDKIDVGKLVLEKREIKVILFDNETNSFEEEHKALWTQYHMDRRRDIARPASEKAAWDTKNRFSMLYRGITGVKEVPEDISQEAYNAALRFFEENPGRRYCFEAWEDICAKLETGAMRAIGGDVVSSEDNIRKALITLIEDSAMADKVDMFSDRKFAAKIAPMETSAGFPDPEIPDGDPLAEALGL